jgi:hypothetical protein
VHDEAVGIWEQSGSGDSIKLSAAGSRFKGGLFVVDVEVRRDRIVFNVFTSRPTTYDELRDRFTLADSEGTEYAIASGSDAIDGKGTIEFVPGLPTGATSLALREPGRSLNLLAWKT